jgi:hypothetical protein
MSLRLKIELAKIVDVVPFGGLTPGSNAASYMAVETPNGFVAGEDIESLLRAGWLKAEPLQSTIALEAGENDVGAPDVEVTHAYDITKEGLLVIAYEADAA